MQSALVLRPRVLRPPGRSRPAALRVRANAVQQLSIEDVLGNLRKARSDVNPDKEAHVKGRGRHLGISITWSVRWRPDGAFHEQIIGKELQFSWGHDGNPDSSAWELDSSGVSRQLDCDDNEALLTSVWLRTGLWLYPPISNLLSLQLSPPVALPQKDASSSEGAGAVPGAPLVMSIRMNSGRLLTRLRICTNKWVIQGLDQPVCGDVESWQFGNWMQWPSGVTYPTEYVHSSVGGGQHAYLTQSCELLDPSPLSDYKIPPSPLLPLDTLYDASKPATVAVWRASSGHLLVQPEINGQAGGFMVLDTGASGFVITPEAAEEMGLELFGELFAACISGKVASKFVKAESWQLGPVKILKPVMMTMELAGLVRGCPGGGKVIGIVGYDLFRRSVVQLPAMANLDRLDTKLSLSSGIAASLAGESSSPFGTAGSTNSSASSSMDSTSSSIWRSSNNSRSFLSSTSTSSSSSTSSSTSNSSSGNVGSSDFSQSLYSLSAGPAVTITNSTYSPASTSTSTSASTSSSASTSASTSSPASNSASSTLGTKAAGLPSPAMIPGALNGATPTVTIISNGAQQFHMTLHPPHEESMERDWDWRPLKMVSNLPHVEAAFPDESGDIKQVLLMLDTGACGSDIMLHSRAVRELELSKTKPSKRVGSGSTHHVVRGVGGGSSEGVRVEVKHKPWAEVAGLRFEQVQIMIAGMSGLDISIYSSGIICADLITRRPFVLDYTRRRIGLPKQASIT